jgi:NAD(P)-dependent dehydrogenase (short-subunit alcohol dehydrogenase family)
MNRERVAVVTGASSGLGKETAKALAMQGWRVIGIGRNPGRTKAAEDEITAAAPAARVDMLKADLALLADAKRVAEEIAGLTDHVDVLINNAGGMAQAKHVTTEGNEENFAGNHLGPFLLTAKLLPLLRAAAATAPKGSVRIINTSSDASEMTPGMNFDDIQLLKNFSSGGAYCNAKLANVLFAFGLAQRLAGDGIVAHALHPGTVMSNFFENAAPSTLDYIKTLPQQTPEQGADALIWLATGDEPGRSSGNYYYKREQHAPNPFAADDANVARLWAESETLVAAAGY